MLDETAVDWLPSAAAVASHYVSLLPERLLSVIVLSERTVYSSVLVLPSHTSQSPPPLLISPLRTSWNIKA